jgi:DHA2 family multidrug resistance protein-like MFS transporter
MPALPGALPAPRPAVVDVALWGIAVLAVVTGLLGFGAPGERLINVTLIGGGALGLVALSVRWRRDREALGGLRLERRAMGAALAVGVVVGFSQMIPLLLLPGIFTYILRYGSLWATIAIAPFAIALFVAGPISGLLLQRFGPRTIVLGGTTALALGNLALAAILDRFGIETAYAWFIVPLALIGAGFVVATTVRTAIVFAATPRGLPASAAGYNEASVGLGSRVGTIAATLVVTSVSLDWLRQHLAGAPDASATVEQFRSILLALGLPGFGDLIAGASLQDRVAFASAYLVGVDVTLLVSGLLGVAGAVLAWFLIGRRDPLRTVFEMQEERDGPAAPHPSSREGAPSA